MLLLLDLQFCSNVHAIKYSSEIEMWQHSQSWSSKNQEKNVVKVKDEFSWKSFGTIPGKYLKCTLSKKEQVLQRMRLGVFRMFYTNNCVFFLAAEFKKVLLSVGRAPPMLPPLVNQNLKRQIIWILSVFKWDMPYILSELIRSYLISQKCWVYVTLCDCTVMFGLKSIKWGNASDTRCLFLEEFHFL